MEAAGTSRHLPLLRLTKWYEPSASATGCLCWVERGAVRRARGPGVHALATVLVDERMPGGRVDPRCRRRAGRPATEPEQAVDEPLVLLCAGKGGRRTRVGVVVHGVVPEVGVQHLVVLVGPQHGVEAAAPLLVRIGADREAGRVDRG